jgi:hypothetical protein
VCCQVEASESDRSLIQRSPTECGVSENDRVASIMRRPWPIRGIYAIEGKKFCPAPGRNQHHLAMVIAKKSEAVLGILRSLFPIHLPAPLAARSKA